MNTQELNVSNPERWLSVVAGSAVAAYGLTRRSLSGLVLAGLGGALMWRGASGHCAVYEALGLNTHGETDDGRAVSVPYGRGIRVEKSITISAAPEQLYIFWHDLTNLPRFMDHLESVEKLEGGRTHWTTKGPAGTKAEWDAEIINDVPFELIGWRSVEGSQVNNAGSVHFTPAAGGRGTTVKVVLRYDPPGGTFGAAVARVFGEDPELQIQEDLRRLKQILETGETATIEGQPTGRKG
jgi:uncharacterized membrane protein